MLLLIALAMAETPLPSFEDELSREVERRVEDLMTLGRAADALETSRTFRTTVTDTAHLAYLEGLILNREGRLEEAESAYRRSIELDEGLAEAWYDLGELLLVRGAFEESGIALSRSTALYTRGSDAWRSPLREAEVAGHLRRPEDLEAHLRVALERGFSFRSIEGMPQWQQFYADPMLRDTVQKLVTVYGSPETLETLIPLRRRIAGEGR